MLCRNKIENYRYSIWFHEKSKPLLYIIFQVWRLMEYGKVARFYDFTNIYV